MKINQIVLLLVASCFLLPQCYEDYPTPCPSALKLDNKTNKDVYVLISYDYPDTSLNFQSPFTNPASTKVGAHSKVIIKDRYFTFCMDSYFDGRPKDTLSFFVFDAALVDTTDWIKIRQNYQVMKRFDVGKDNALNNNYTLTLP
jgi:hypothetical protein